ncbi:MAG: nucleotidyltransferase domain-containing protein [Burkholderiales bacterium]
MKGTKRNISLGLSIADALFGKAQRAVLALLFGQSGRAFYVREVVAAAGAGGSQVQKELDNLARAGLVLREPRGNQVWFRANPASPVFAELKSLVAKTFGIADIVREALRPFSGKIAAAFIYGSVARGEHDAASDVDVLVVGDVAPSRIAPVQLELGATLGRRISLVFYDTAEMTEHIATREHFVSNVMSQPKIWLYGSEESLKSLNGKTTRQPRRRKAA